MQPGAQRAACDAGGCPYLVATLVVPRCVTLHDPDNMIYTCGHPERMDYNESENICEANSGGKYKSYDECEEQIKYYNFLDQWQCRSRIGRTRLQKPIYHTLEECRVDSQKICKSLTDPDPDKRANGIAVLASSANGRTLPDIDCHASIAY